jgi:glutamate N-acetyltransferase/amino-acid N-acetyltransferase
VARTAAAAARLLRSRRDQVMVASTGVIGVQLPIELIEGGLVQAVGELSTEPSAFLSAASAMLTTDMRPKLFSDSRVLGGREVRVLGLAKGAAMIGPRMATMLAFILTDAPVWANDLNDILHNAVDRSFNCLSVEGHASTNDTVLLISSTAATDPILRGEDVAAFVEMVQNGCESLARQIADDGEGATHLVTIDVEGCENEADARAIARVVAESPLVKTAIHGADPNWGRVVSAAGYAGVSFREEDLSLWINGVAVYQQGTPVPFDEGALTQMLKVARPVHLRLFLRSGTATARFWTCDLSADYVRLNADYKT